MKKTLTIIGLAVATLAGAQAQTLFSDNFNSYTTGNLVGQGGWVQTGGTATSPVQVNAGVVGPNVQGSAQDVSHSFTPVTTGSFYYGINFNFTSKNVTGDYFVNIADSSSGNGFSSRLYARSTGAGYQLAWGGSSTAPTVYGAELAFNINYRAIMRYDIVSGLANDTGALYVTSGSFDIVESNNTPYQDVTTWTFGVEQTAFGAFNIRQGTNTGVMTLDNLNVGTTFASAVPEPATWALIGISSSFMLWNVRRRRSVQA